MSGDSSLSVLFTSILTGLPFCGSAPTIEIATAGPSHAAVHIAAESGSHKRPGIRLVTSEPSRTYLIVAGEPLNVRVNVSTGSWWVMLN